MKVILKYCSNIEFDPKFIFFQDIFCKSGNIVLLII